MTGATNPLSLGADQVDVGISTCMPRGLRNEGRVENILKGLDDCKYLQGKILQIFQRKVVPFRL